MKKTSFAKKFAVSAMAVLMTAALFTGCGGDDKDVSGGPVMATSSSSEELDLLREPLLLTEKPSRTEPSWQSRKSMTPAESTECRSDLNGRTMRATPKNQSTHIIH